MQATGILKKISMKRGTNARGGWTAYSICVGPAGNSRDNDVWYRYGFDAPKADEGSTVKFEYEDDGRGNKKVKANSLMVDKTAPAQKPQAAGGGGINNDARQNSIVRQNATTSAINLANLMITHAAVPLPAKKSDRYDFVLELVTKLADHLFPTLMNPPTIDELAQAAAGDEVVDKEFADMEEEDVFQDDDKWAAV